MNQLILTTGSTTFGLAGKGNFAAEAREEGGKLAPVERISGTTRPVDSELTPVTFDIDEAPQKSFEPPVVGGRRPSDVSANSTPLQIWEGTVVEVDRTAGTMQVLLDAKMGQMPQHTAEIDLEWVDDQDKDLVCPGAVFYLTLFKRTKPSVENAQELRFRRRPSWSASQIEQIKHEAAALRSKIRAAPTAP